jgi:hypothetical protein
MSSERALKFVTSALEQAYIPFMIVGSFASNLYGVGRTTFDIDIVVSANAEQLQSFLSSFSKTDWYYDLQDALEACRRRSMFNILDMAGGLKVDIIFMKIEPYHRVAFERRAPAEIDHVPLYAATAEDVVISKLDWARMGSSSRQIEDVAGILEEQKAALDFGYIEKWVGELQLSEQWNSARKLAGLE